MDFFEVALVIAAGGITLEYEMHRADSDVTVLFLHGWGGDLSSFAASYVDASAWGVNCINLAFPKVVPPHFGIYDYAASVADAVGRLGINRLVTVGHSFGGRVALLLAARGLCEKIVLVSAAGMKPRFSLARAVRIARYKFAKKHGKPLDGYGSVDYNNLGSDMRGVFVRVVNTHLERILPYIACPALLYWGRDDRDTPPYMARRLKRGIKNSKLVMADGGHFAYLQNRYGFAAELKNFILD